MSKRVLMQSIRTEFRRDFSADALTIGYQVDDQVRAMVEIELKDTVIVTALLLWSGPSIVEILV